MGKNFFTVLASVLLSGLTAYGIVKAATPTEPSTTVYNEQGEVIMEKKQTPVRNERYSFLVNPDERQTIENYLRKYKIRNRSRWMRETLMTFIIKNLDQDYPTLFNEQEMRR